MSRRPWWQRIFVDDRHESDSILAETRKAIERLDEALRSVAEPPRRRDDG